MVNIIPARQRKPSLGEQLSSGIGKGLDFFSQMQAQQQQKEALKGMGIDPRILQLPENLQKPFLESILPQQEKPLNALQKQKLENLQQQSALFNQLFPGTSQQQQDFENQVLPTQQPQGQQIFSQMPDDKLRQAAAFAGQPGDMGMLGNMAQAELDKREKEAKGRSDKEARYFAFNEPKLAQIADTERKLNIENARYNRLGELFADPSKFPSSLTAALFTKEGQLSDIAYSQLSPEAQEAVKLIIDSTSNIKDTYGARVTNFDLQTYLRKLPSLLNTPEGRFRVLRDLQEINNINQLYNAGIQEIFDEAGGTDQIAFSEAEKRFKKKYGKELNRMLENFSSPERAKFMDKPDAKKYLGQKIKDEETGEIFISDGIEWKPYRG